MNAPLSSSTRFWGLERFLLYCSLFINFLLFLALIYERTRPRNLQVVIPPPPIVTNLLEPQQPNAIPRALSWEELKGRNIQELAANLRTIGCPETVVQAVVVQLVTQKYQERALREIPRPEYNWWDPDASEAMTEQINEAAARLETERSLELISVLGRDWNKPDARWIANLRRPLEGPILGQLPEELKSQVRELEERYLTNDEAAADPKNWLRLKEALSEILTHEQLEEYMLRYSPVATSLRQSLKGQKITPELFRQLYYEQEKALAKASSQSDQSFSEGMDTSDAMPK